MFIRIKTSFHDFTLNFHTQEELKKIHGQITEALIDPNNIKGVVFKNGERTQMFPSLLLKSSVIEITGLIDDEKNPIIIF